jgi:polyribonucleotide nucleotidyltransferase
MEINKFKTKIGERTLEVQIGGLAQQASGCCLVKYGETSVLVTSQLGEVKEEIDFFPLTCDYEERYYAAGRIGGSRFIRREGRPTPEAVLTSRMIDRSLRPLFPEGFLNEVQVIATCLSWDGENEPGILGILGASLALVVSEIPWQGPVGAVRVAKVSENFILNPTYSQREEAEMDIVFSGVQNEGDILINMIEAKGEEVSEETIIKAFEFAKPFIKELLNFQKEIAESVGKEKIPFQPPSFDPEFTREVKKFLEGRLEESLYQKGRKERYEAIKNLKEELFEKIKNDYDESQAKDALFIFGKEQERILKENIIEKEKRPDGRKLDEIRKIEVKAGILPRTHGSGLFSRGETRVLSILTLGSPHDQQLLEGMEIVGKKRFIHHYNFPPYSAGEVRRLGPPGRREIGHGMLVEKALLPLIPSFEDFPYTMRVVSEVLSSNGSTSMASVSAVSLALMDAGVPISRPAAGIAIGLFGGEGKNYKVLTDIQGPEDHFGEMDFKVAGTEKGITAIQMDVKIKGITKEILREALNSAKKARIQILEIQRKALARPRPQLSPFAPRVYSIKISPDKIGNVIGPGGRVINEIIGNCGVSIDIEESGKVFVTAEKEEAAKKAIDWIRNLTREVKIGEVFKGKVKRILDFGVIVELSPGQEGLCHISQLTPFRIRRIEDVVKVGDIIPVKVISIDEQGRISLSAKEAGFKPKNPQKFSLYYGKKRR